MSYVKKGAAIDTPMTGFPNVPTPSSGTAGKYGEGSGIGPKGVDGGVPLKFVDTSITAARSQPIETQITVQGAKTLDKP